MIEDDAPGTCDAVWNALPLEGETYHAKHSGNEVYTLVPPFAASEPGLENATFIPDMGDLCYYYFEKALFPIKRLEKEGLLGHRGVVDLAVFYGPDNLVMWGPKGFVLGSRFARVVHNLEEFAEACYDVFRAGGRGERMLFQRAEAPR
jgi:hypothetical protein